MKIRMMVSVAGPGFSLSPGDETERFSDREARKLIAAGFAVPVVGQKLETAVKPRAPETRDRFDHDGDGRPGGSLPADERDVSDDLRAEYERLAGEPADRRWGERRLREEIAKRG